MKLLDTTHTLYTKEDADNVAAKMTKADDEGWTYVAVHDPAGTGYSFIEVYDECGEFVGRT